MGGDDAKRVILARRARFITAALASAGIAASCGDTESEKPQVCLSQVKPDAEADAEADGSTGGASGTGGTGGSAIGGAAGEPQVCLSQPLGGSGGK